MLMLGWSGQESDEGETLLPYALNDPLSIKALFFFRQLYLKLIFKEPFDFITGNLSESSRFIKN